MKQMKTITKKERDNMLSPAPDTRNVILPDPQPLSDQKSRSLQLLKHFFFAVILLFSLSPETYACAPIPYAIHGYICVRADGSRYVAIDLLDPPCVSLYFWVQKGTGTSATYTLLSASPSGTPKPTGYNVYTYDLPSSINHDNITCTNDLTIWYAPSLTSPSGSSIPDATWAGYYASPCPDPAFCKYIAGCLGSSGYSMSFPYNGDFYLWAPNPSGGYFPPVHYSTAGYNPTTGLWDYTFPISGISGCQTIYCEDGQSLGTPPSDPHDWDPSRLLEATICPCCNAHFTYSLHTSLPGNVAFATSSAGALSYQWDFGDGHGTTTTASGVNYTYTVSGSHHVQLLVTAADHSTCHASLDICTSNTPSGGAPYCQFSINNITPGSSPSIDVLPDVSMLGATYTWDFGDGTPPYSTTSTALLHYSYAAPGTYTVTMTVSGSGITGCYNLLGFCISSAYGAKPGRGANGPGMTQNPSNEDELLSMISIAPNPASDNTMLKFDLAADQTNMNVQLIDITGRMIKNVFSGSLQAGTQRINIPTADLNSGYYFVKITTSLGTTTERLSVVK